MRKFFKAICAVALCISVVIPALAAGPSGALPVLTIDTENSAPILSKEEYVAATYTLDPKGHEDVEAFSGALQIRGRGNWTWTGFDKKPYRLKLENKAALLGFKKSKHFVLLAHADDNLGLMREPLGFKMSELAGMDWTPGQKPVEVVLNGDYIGLYFLVENIRVDADRVDVFNQEDEDPVTDPSGGWLCEIDNYDEDPSEQIKITESNGQVIRITHKSPELINAEQEKFLRDQMIAIDKAFYIQDPDSREFEKLVDINSLAAFYVIQELMDGQESFHGSCYLHRDRGADKKWVWGPVWDFGNTYARGSGKFIYEDSPYGQTWIGEVVKFKSFQDAYKDRFKAFIENDYSVVKQYIADYAAGLSAAAEADAERWPAYGNADIVNRANSLLTKLAERVRFLGEKWGVDTPVGSGVYLRGDFNDWNASEVWEFEKTGDNVYRYRGADFSGRFKIADIDWHDFNWGVKQKNQEIPLDTPMELIFGEKSTDMVATPGFKEVIFTIITPGEKATVELSTRHSGIAGVVAEGPCVSVCGRDIVVSGGSASVYDLSGRCLSSSATRLTVAPGLYVVSLAGKSVKAVVR